MKHVARQPGRDGQLTVLFSEDLDYTHISSTVHERGWTSVPLQPKHLKTSLRARDRSIRALCQLACALLTACVCIAEAHGNNQLVSAAAGHGSRPLPSHRWPNQRSQGGSTSSAAPAAPDRARFFGVGHRWSGQPVHGLWHRSIHMCVEGEHCTLAVLCWLDAA